MLDRISSLLYRKLEDHPNKAFTESVWLAKVFASDKGDHLRHTARGIQLSTTGYNLSGIACGAQSLSLGDATSTF